MAMADYYLCDNCGGKCFYESQDVELALERAGDIAAICKECSKTHECIIVGKPGGE